MPPAAAAAKLPHCAAAQRVARPPRPGRRAVCTAAAVTEAQRVQFNDNTSASFSPILNGCWTLAGGHGRVEPKAFVDVAVKHAEAGLTTFDTADIYGPSEAILGEFRRAWAERKGAGAPQPQLFTKYVPNIFQSRPTRASVEASIRRSLKALDVPALDLVQMHWWDYGVPGMVDAGLALADLKAAGLIKSVGVTNMSTEALAQLVDAGVPVVCNQVQFSLLDRRPLNSMTAYCAARDIKLFTYGTLGGGLLSDKHAESSGNNMFGKPRYMPVDLNTSSLKMYWRQVELAGGQDVWRALVVALRGVAQRRGTTVAAVALRWAMDQGAVHPIVGVRNATHIEDNLAALALKLDAQDMQEIDAALAAMAKPRGDCYSYERGE